MRPVLSILERSCPRNRIEPSVGCVIPKSRRASVVLPLPLSPATAVIIGFSSLRVSDILSTATVWLLLIIPLPKTFDTFCASNIGIRTNSHYRDGKQPNDQV